MHICTMYIVWGKWCTSHQQLETIPPTASKLILSLVLRYPVVVWWAIPTWPLHYNPDFFSMRETTTCIHPCTEQGRLGYIGKVCCGKEFPHTTKGKDIRSRVHSSYPEIRSCGRRMGSDEAVWLYFSEVYYSFPFRNSLSLPSSLRGSVYKEQIKGLSLGLPFLSIQIGPHYSGQLGQPYISRNFNL